MKYKKYKMLRTCKGSITGWTVEEFIKGIEYDLPPSLGDVFVKAKDAVEIIKNKKIVITNNIEKTMQKPKDIKPKMEEPKYEKKVVFPSNNKTTKIIKKKGNK